MAATAAKDASELSAEEVAYTNGPVLLTVTGAFYTVSLLTVMARGYSRRFIVNSFGKDDWAMVVALVCATVCFGSYAHEVSLGVGKYIAVIMANEGAYRQILKARQIHIIAAVVGTSVSNISVALFQLRLAIERLYSYFLWGIIAFTVCFTVACACTLIFQCLPIQAAWDTRLRPPPIGKGDAKCYSQQTFKKLVMFNGIICIVIDFVLALLPIPLIWTLRISARSRLSLTFVLGLGLFAAVVGIARQTSVPRMYTEAEPWVRDSYAVWQFIEFNVGIIAASLPATKPLLSMCFDPANGFSRGDGSAENDGNNSQGALQEHGAQHNEEPNMAHGQEPPPKRARRRHSLSISLAETLYNPQASMTGDVELEELGCKNKKGVVGVQEDATQ